MNRAERRAHAKRMHAKYTEELRPIPRAEWPLMASLVSSREPERVLVSRGFLVLVYDEEHALGRLSICRTTIGPTDAWEDRITWDELQSLKRQAGYGDAMALEVYPPDAHVVNVANMRHLWLVDPEAVPFAWHRDAARRVRTRGEQ